MTDPIITPIDEWRGLSASEVSDALDRLGLPGGALDIRSITDGLCLYGRAFTVRYGPAETPPRTIGDFLDDVPPGAVIVIDNAGRLDCTVWGGIMSTIARARGIGGTVVNGVCRDVAVAREVGYPVFSRGRFMRTGKDRVQLEALEQPVSLGDVRVHPGDIVIGNDDGVVVVPAAHERAVLERTRATRAAEQRIMERVRNGQTLREARAQEGYHLLQRAEQ